MLVIAIASFALGGNVLRVLLGLISLQAYKEMLEAMSTETRITPVGDAELSDAIEKKNSNRKYLTWLGFFFIIVLYVFLGINYIPVGIGILAFLIYMAIYSITFPRYHIYEACSACFSFIYGPVMLSFIFLCRELPIGRYIVWFILICSWGSDTFAYCVGMLLGRHKMAPLLSPNKSVEGAIGGLAGSALLGGLYGWYLMFHGLIDPQAGWVFPIIGVFGALISIVGDLSASAIKRDHGIKDYSNIIPGHGGIMDRFDSVIFVAPVIFFLGKYFLD